MQDSRKAILKTAITEFAKTGVFGTTIESVAEAAGVDPAIARSLFVDRNGLLRATVEEITSPNVAAISMAVEGIDDPREFVRASMKHFDRFLYDNPDLVRAMQRCMADDPMLMATIYQTSMFPSEFAERLHSFVEKGQMRGDLLSVFMMLDSLMLFAHWVRPSFSKITDMDEDKVFETRFEFIMDVLENGLYTK